MWVSGDPFLSNSSLSVGDPDIVDHSSALALAIEATSDLLLDLKVSCHPPDVKHS